MASPNENFGNFVNILTKANIIDSTYPVKGCYVWMPYGFEFKENVFSSIEKYIKIEDYNRYQFPRLIPGNSIRSVTRGVASFEEGVFWLRRKNGEELDLFLNPTGECGVYTMFKKWIRQESDLPIKLYQIGATFRPHKRPDAMLNGDELSNLLEGHSAFASKREADNEFIRISKMFKKVHTQMGIPFLSLRRPLLGNNPVCSDMMSFETYLPSKGTSFNVGVLYNQGQIYSKAFDVKFSNQDGEKENTYQVTFGISERGIAAMLDLHKDNYGLRLLPEFAPIQVLVIPILDGKNNKELVRYGSRVCSQLNEYRVSLENNPNKRSGKKFAIARQKGIPIRIGISKEDLDNETLRVYLRTDEEPHSGVPLSRLQENISKYIEGIRNKIIKDATLALNSRIRSSRDFKGIESIIQDNLLARIHWCGDLNCLRKMQMTLSGELIGTETERTEKGSCLVCKNSTNHSSYYSKRGASP